MRFYIILFLFLSFGYSQDKYERFNSQWYIGKAELTSYTLEQARYGEIHRGHAVLIFVTEDFSRSKQVKLDWPIKNQRDKVNVLKLNFTKKFNTGIYPYSMMSSIFTPVDIDKRQSTLKISTSSQEWCGHTFSQLNRTDNGYRFQLHSYFESEGEQDFEVDDAILEDEIWTLIRLNPEFLPIGSFKIIPGTFYTRLSHKDMIISDASGSLIENNDKTSTYTLSYKDTQRTLKIIFNRTFPFEIQGWEETLKSGFGANAKTLTTKATLNKRIMLDYWSKNSIFSSILSILLKSLILRTILKVDISFKTSE